MNDALLFVVFALAVWRVSRIIVAEDGPFDVLSRLRERTGITKQRTWIARGFMCVACISFWLGIAAAFLWHGFSFGSLVYGLALSAASVILMRKVG